MLVLTDQTQQVVRDLVAGGDVGPDGGLRITASAQNGETALDFELAAEPAAGDVVVEAGGARVFLDEVAANVLDDRMLDVHGHDDHYHFDITDP